MTLIKTADSAPRELEPIAVFIEEETAMSTFNLEKIFRPLAVAVVGASERERTVGYALMKNLKGGGYEGKIIPVNPRHDRLHGLQAYPTLSSIREHVDLAVIATPIETVPSIIEECAASKIGGAIVISAGGKESGIKGQEIEAKIGESARRGSVRIIGPNCLGVLCSETNLNASFSSRMTLPGKLAFISQSGALCTAILDLSLKERIGFSHFVSIGSMLDVDFGDLINYLGNDPGVSSIALYIESLSNFRKFMSAARSVSRVKPIVVLKSGRSPAGARAASSHTGALAGEDAVYDAAFKRAGIVRVNTIEELFDCAELMAKQPRPAGPGLAVVTNAGGPGVMAADAMAFYGLEPVPLSNETTTRLNEVLPPYWSHGNPIDIVGDASPERYLRTVEICMSACEIDSLLIILTPQAFTDPSAVAESLCGVLDRKRISVFTVWMGGADVEKGREIFNQAGIPTYETPERAVKAFMYMYSYACNLELLQQIPPKLPHDLEFHRTKAGRIIHKALEGEIRLLTEVESKALLAAYGIPVNSTEVAASPGEAAQLAEKMGYPVVMKICSRDITHKSDAQGVRLNLQNEKAVREAFSAIMAAAAAYNRSAKLLGVTVQSMIEHRGYELILGCKKDTDFGPVILFGTGGIMTEILRDMAIDLPPLNRLLARRLIEKTRAYQLLKGFRNRPPADLILLEEILIRLSHLVIDFPEIVELDINPMTLNGERACALDARVILEPSPVRSPMHLVISSYPTEQETTVVTEKGVSIFIRPVKPEDASLIVDFYNALAPTTVYFRFFTPLQSLSHEMLVRLTQIDYDRDVVLVAMQQPRGEEPLLGIVRLMSDPDVTKAEFSVVVGDRWQAQGVGAALLEQCLSIARERGIESIRGLILAENTTMIALGRRLGFSVDKIPGGKDYELRIELKDLKPKPE